MISDQHVKEWMGGKSQSARAVIELAKRRENWVSDGDASVQNYINLLSKEVEDAVVAQGDIYKKNADIKAIANQTVKSTAIAKTISPEIIVELQGQFSFDRGIKLFIDSCDLDPERALEMLNFNVDSLQNKESRKIFRLAGTNLVARLMMLTKMKILKDVFGSQDRYATIKEAISNVKDNKDEEV